MSLKKEVLLLTHDFEVTLRLQVFDGRVIHQADDRDAVVLPPHLQHQLTGHREHVGPLLHLGLACGERSGEQRDHGRELPPANAHATPPQRLTSALRRPQTPEATRCTSPAPPEPAVSWGSD